MGSSLNRQIGSIFLIIGTEIGAGVLALPIIITNSGLLVGSIVMILSWAVMLFTALLIVEANSAMEGDVSFSSMAKKFLGKWGKLFMAIVFWCTLSSIAMAYISAAGSTFTEIIQSPPLITSIVFVVVFGIFVIIGTKAVDYVNRLLLSLKLLAFILAILFLLGAMKVINLSVSGNMHLFVSSIPAVFVSFVLHNIIPSIRTYLDYDKKALRRVVIIGSIVPLILYILWVFAVIGSIPPHGAHSFDLLISKGKQANVGDLLTLVALNISNKTVIMSINFVAAISVTTSFLGCSISLYHFVQDTFGHEKRNLLTRTILPILLTFVIPLLIVILFPNIFIAALGYAGEGATILFVLIPIIIVWKLIKQGNEFSWKFLSNKFLLSLAFLLGLGIIAIEILFR